MFRQIPCEYKHEHKFARTPVKEIERSGNDRVIIHYDVYFCELCSCTFKIIKEISVKKDYYKWM